MKKVLSVLLATVMLLSVMSFTVAAEGEQNFIDGGIETTFRLQTPLINDNSLNHFRKIIEGNPQFIFNIVSEFL